MLVLNREKVCTVRPQGRMVPHFTNGARSIDEGRVTVFRKSVKVVYDWKPPVCLKCCVFGHSTVKCGSNSEVQYTEPVVNKKDRANVQRKKSVGINEKVLRPNFKPNTQPPKGGNKKQENINDDVNLDGGTLPKTLNKKQWNVNDDILSAMKRSANKYTMLELYDENEIMELQEMKNRDKVEKFISLKKDPTESEIKSWNADMVAYYKQRKKQVSHNMEDQINDDMIGGKEVDDVFEDESGMAESVNGNMMDGLDRGCSALLYMLQMEEKKGDYYGRTCRSIKELWGNMPWIMMGDMNVTLKPNEHSCGGSSLTSDMIEFNDCINNIEMEDITSFGLFYTWTKNLFKAKAGDNTGVLKKLDRTMANEEFIDKFPKPMLPEGKLSRCYMFKTVKKLKSLKKDLRRLAWENGNVFYRVKSLRNQLKEDEEKILYQKAKIKWLSVGDRNNAYFHKILKSRSHKNRINQISDGMGNRYYGEKATDQFVNHFKKFLGEAYPVSGLENIEALIEKKLSAEDALDMVRMVNDEEIKTAMFQIDGNKAPGPDGFSAYFFKKSWSIVGTDVCNAVKEFFRTGKLLNEVNSTLISLIPKILTHDKVTDFRPITCFNVLYKCISKIITDRMKNAIGKIVGLNQSAFVPNRHVQDNILLSQELLRGYERKDGPKRVAMKIDIQKAYDTVNWVGEALDRKKVEEKKDFRYHFGCKQLKLTHVYFADDLLMFCHGDVVSVGVLKEAIEEFGAISGLLPNYTKSTIIFGSMRMEDQQSILNCVPFKVEKLLIKYLGVPLTSKRIGANNCKSLIDKVKSRVSNWKNKCLSYAGRLQLISSILESIHVYWASVFLLPQGVIKDINKILKGFLWSQGELSKGKANVAWRNICSPKNQGGFGLKDLVLWNKKMIIKHLWYIAVDKNSLWVKWVNTVKLKGKVGNGEKTSVPYDNWCNAGILQSFLTHRDMYNGRVKADTVVKEIMNNGICEWPTEWTEKFPILNLHKCITLDSSKSDELVWRSRSGKESKFSVKQAYDDLKGRVEEVTWARLVWFSQNIPKHSFILWMAILNKLTTQDKVKN
ncbi:RNA-directed DNA polymerase, eukaryota, reverse transcriptase zinc-binding domain protein [Tanacetum coccineum]